MESTELIHELPKALLKWYPFEAGKRALMVMAGSCADQAWEEALTECGLEVESISAPGLQPECLKGKYEYVVAVEALEKVQQPGKLLAALKEYTAASGRLILGMNNRMGLRYFCGDRDPYTERSFDGIENYRRAYSKAEDVFQGRMYDKAQIKQMLQAAGWNMFQFFSVLPDLKNASHIFAEDYIPKEDLCNRLFTAYNYPDTVFLEEKTLYQQFIDNQMFPQVANAYFIECSLGEPLCGISHVTSSLDRGREDAMLTIVHKHGKVIKRAAYPEGRKRLKELISNNRRLEAGGIEVVSAVLNRDSYEMPFIDAEVGQKYLKRLLVSDKERFIQEMDHFRDLILQSSEVIEPDQGDGNGAVLKYGFYDMVPLNSFYIKDKFVFFDQEFCRESYPANAMIWRMVSSFYSGVIETKGVIQMDYFLERYDLKRYLAKWENLDREFIRKLRREGQLKEYYERIRVNNDIANTNRQRMNYSTEKYQKLFIDIFEHADTRKLILFGSGSFAEKFLALYRKDFPVYAVIDNNCDRWGQEVGGIRIQSPEILKELQSGEYKVIVCIKNYLSVMKQLDQLGVGDYSIYDRNRAYPRKLRAAENSAEAGSGIQKPYHIGYVAGAFDMFHIGHLNLLRRAKEMCDYLIVGVISDEAVWKLKNKAPIIPCDERVEVVAGCRYVDQAEALPVSYGGIRDAYKMFHFDCQFTGDDHADDEGWNDDKKYLRKQGADIVFFPYTKKTSSTHIREKLV